MLLDIKPLYEVTDKKVQFNCTAGTQKTKQIKGYSFARPIDIDGVLFNRAGVVNLNYSVRFILHAVCDRCLAVFSREFEYSFEHILVRSLNTDNDEYIVTKDDKLELEDIVFTDVLLQFPSKMLCKNDCAGLCPHCGTDLNNKECNCRG